MCCRDTRVSRCAYTDQCSPKLVRATQHSHPHPTARELSDVQFGTPNRVLRRSCMSSYSLSLPASVAITLNSFGSVWTSSRYSAQPPAPNPHESSLMRSLVHPIGSCEGPACIAHPYPFLSVSVTRSSIKLHYYIASGHAASGRVTLLYRVSLHRVTSHQVTSHWVAVTHQTCLVLWTWRKLADETNAKNTPKIC